MSPLARVSEEHLGEIVIAAVEGEVDASNAVEIGDRLRATMTNRSVALLIDLGGTTYIDSAGINVIFALGRELRQRRQRLHLIVPDGSPVGRMLAIAGLDAAVAMHGTREGALDQAAAADG
jgi:anti-anti-sigma factor